jgi:hypothetical protein
MSYDRACRRAATDQGLDPITVAAWVRKNELEKAGVSYYVEQTGGFTMVACFYTSAHEAITVTNEGAWIVCVQDTPQWLDGSGDKFEDLSSTEIQDADAIVDTVLARARASAS